MILSWPALLVAVDCAALCRAEHSHGSGDVQDPRPNLRVVRIGE
jgi:hypothetical protein